MLPREVSQYLASIGRKGGSKSRRVLDPQFAKRMVKLRVARRLFKENHARCFWSFDKDYRIEFSDIAWVGLQLMKNGNRDLFLNGYKLCH